LVSFFFRAEDGIRDATVTGVQTCALPILSSLAYAGIPYQSLGVRAGALSLIIMWSRLAMVRSGSRISAIFASTTLSPSPLASPRSEERRVGKQCAAWCEDGDFVEQYALSK